MPTPILIDTDMAIDDWLAILFLLRNPLAEVRAITVAATGEAHARPGEANARRLLSAAGYKPIPTAAGSQAPIEGQRAFPLVVRLLMDWRMFLPLPAPQRAVNRGQSAVDLIIQTLMESSEPVTIVVLGPLTNLAQALQKQPEIVRKVGGIWIMGGALDVPGNLGSVSPALRTNKHAEWNIYIDPHAANIVFASGAPVILIPLDATNQVPLTAQYMSQLKKMAQNDTPHPAAVFSYRALERIFRLSNGREFYFWDPLAAAAAIKPELVRLEALRLRVIEAQGDDCGRVINDQAGYLVQAALSADSVEFEKIYLDTLSHA